VSRRADIVTAALAIAAHAVVGFAITRQDARPKPAKRTIDVEFRKPTPPPPPPPVAAQPEPAPAKQPAPRPIARKVAVRTLAPKASPAPPSPTPPAPAAAPAPKAAPPVYGIAMESPTDASSAVAAPRGGSGRGVAGGVGRQPSGAPGGTGSGPAIAAELSIKQMPEVDTEACGRSIGYPAEAERAGIEGKVRLRVALDARGKVTSARVLRGLGYGLDQAAVEALTHRCRFTPAIAADGRPAPFVIESYTFAFELPR
jgi:protein TonB